MDDVQAGFPQDASTLSERVAFLNWLASLDAPFPDQCGRYRAWARKSGRWAVDRPYETNRRKRAQYLLDWAGQFFSEHPDLSVAKAARAALPELETAFRDAEKREEQERQSLLDETEQWLFSEPLWAIDHVLFWAATRDRSAMAEYFAGSARAIFGEVFRDLHFTTLRIWLQEREQPTHAKLKDIETAARRGLIVIEGRENDSTEWKPIPSGDWAGGPSPGGLVIYEDSQRGPYAAREREIPHRKIWTDLRVNREQVIDAFPPLSTSDECTISWPAYRPSSWDYLLDRVYLGDLTPEQGEAEALRLGLPPIDPEPEGAAFDPMQRLTWTFAMALAWIMWRNSKRVRLLIPEYRDTKKHWVQTVRRTPFRTIQFVREHEFKKMSPKGWLECWELSASFNEDSAPLMSLEVALAELVAALHGTGDGEDAPLKAQTADGTKTILASEWPLLRYDEDRNEDVWRRPNGTIAYREIHLRRLAILKIWHDQKPETGTPQSAGAPAHPAILNGIVVERFSKEKHKSKKDWLEPYLVGGFAGRTEDQEYEVLATYFLSDDADDVARHKEPNLLRQLHVRYGGVTAGNTKTNKLIQAAAAGRRKRN